MPDVHNSKNTLLKTVDSQRNIRVKTVPLFPQSISLGRTLPFSRRTTLATQRCQHLGALKMYVRVEFSKSPQPSSLIYSCKATLPSSCSGTSATGPCTSATSTFPRPSPPIPTCATTPKDTTVIFYESATTTFGENIFLLGSIPQLGNWDTSNAVALSASDYTNSNNLWFVTISLPAGLSFEYKYIRKEADGSIIYESGANRRYTVPANCQGEAYESDSWR